MNLKEETSESKSVYIPSTEMNSRENILNILTILEIVIIQQS